MGQEIAFLNPMVQLLEPTMSVLTLQAEEEYRLCAPPIPKKAEREMDFWLTLLPEAWAEMVGLGLAIAQPPVVVALKTTASLIQVQQYPMSKEERESIRRHIRKLLQQRVLVKCQSAWNTPIAPSQKAGNWGLQAIQDIRAVNSRVEAIHPTIPNPYNLLIMLDPSRLWYTVLDLKDAFFCLQLHLGSQPFSSFE